MLWVGPYIPLTRLPSCSPLLPHSLESDSAQPAVCVGSDSRTAIIVTSRFLLPSIDNTIVSVCIVYVKVTQS